MKCFISFFQNVPNVVSLECIKNLLPIKRQKEKVRAKKTSKINKRAKTKARVSNSTNMNMVKASLVIVKAMANNKIKMVMDRETNRDLVIIVEMEWISSD